jgi:hypothetical protein
VLAIFALAMIGLGRIELATPYLIGLPAVFYGVMVGVIVTAIGSALTTPTRSSLIANLLLSGAGYAIGFLAAAFKAGVNPRDDAAFVSTDALSIALLASGMHELVRWLKKLNVDRSAL